MVWESRTAALKHPNWMNPNLPSYITKWVFAEVAKLRLLRWREISSGWTWCCHKGPLKRMIEFIHIDVTMEADIRRIQGRGHKPRNAGLRSCNEQGDRFSMKHLEEHNPVDAEFLINCTK
jgi:hypothetical protein